jgi:SAM-dependent methyltransferase
MSATEATAATWHDVECGGYDADLPLWEELAERQGGPVLELGCGTGRVALHLARRGHTVYALDREPLLLGSLIERAEGLDVEPMAVDGREYQLPEAVSLALAPMQFLQLLPDREARLACLRRATAALRPGGLLAAALVESLPRPEGALPPLPDVREVDGWVYSSLPVAAVTADGRIVLRRLRQTVSPAGELREEEDEVELQAFPAEALEAEAASVGLLPAGRRSVPATEAHVGSVVVLLERSA